MKVLLALLLVGCSSPVCHKVTDEELLAESERVTAMRAEMRGEKIPKEFTPSWTLQVP